MLRIEFEKASAFWTVKFLAMLGMVFFFAAVVAQELERYIFEGEIGAFEDMKISLPPQPFYQELSDGAFIFSHASAVEKKREEMIEGARDFLFADLKEMRLEIYRKGEFADAVAIKAKGKEGSFFETPNGSYTIQLKEKNHFSSIGDVWMPWSIHFFGNYFIHGWPYYPDGTPVADTFSGGCIRLTSEDAKKIYMASKEKMPVLVSAGKDTAPTNFSYFKKIAGPYLDAAPKIPRISVEAALAADFETGQILFEQKKDEAYPIASITKLMTALIAVESLNRFKYLTLTKEVLKEEGDSAGLKEGEEFKSEELLYPLILTSSNDVAKLYQREVWGFTGLMNQKAKAIGMTNTHFADASGLDSKNVSTASDLFRLLQYLYSYKHPIFSLSGMREYRAVSRNKKIAHVWKNVNWSLEDDRFIGGKSGSTPEAKKVMAGVYRLKFAEYGERPVAIIVLGSEDRIADIRSLIQYFENYFVYGAAVSKEKHVPEEGRGGATIYQALENVIQ